jgi:DNA-binding protein YbaB
MKGLVSTIDIRGQVTLMDIDFDPLLSDEEGIKTLSAKMETAMGDDRKTMEALKGIKGLKITTDPEISIEFVPK